MNNKYVFLLAMIFFVSIYGGGKRTPDWRGFDDKNIVALERANSALIKRYEHEEKKLQISDALSKIKDFCMGFASQPLDVLGKDSRNGKGKIMKDTEYLSREHFYFDLYQVINGQSNATDTNNSESYIVIRFFLKISGFVAPIELHFTKSTVDVTENFFTKLKVAVFSEFESCDKRLEHYVNCLEQLKEKFSYSVEQKSFLKPHFSTQ